MCFAHDHGPTLDTILDGVDLDGIGCTPNTEHQMKRKASQVFDKGPQQRNHS